MGLDNGVIVQRKDKKGINIPFYVKDSWDILDDTEGKIELAYWRKCWGIRNKIIGILNGENDCGEYNINIEQLDEIIKLLKKFLHQDYWEQYADSIWEYDEFIERSVQYIINLLWLKDYMIKNPNSITAYFYDSY